jgi:hypothetical protein
VATLLVALKVRHKDRITILRGNHESRQITQVRVCGGMYGHITNHIILEVESPSWSRALCSTYFTPIYVHAWLLIDGLDPFLSHLHTAHHQHKSSTPFDTHTKNTSIPPSLSLSLSPTHTNTPSPLTPRCTASTTSASASTATPTSGSSSPTSSTTSP